MIGLQIGVGAVRSAIVETDRLGLNGVAYETLVPTWSRWSYVEAALIVVPGGLQQKMCFCCMVQTDFDQSVALRI